MTTTVMKDSRVGDQWIYNACQVNPVSYVLDPKTGLQTGSILTGPVRLAFTEGLFEAQHKMKSDPTSAMQFQAVCLFTPWTDLTILNTEFMKMAQAEFNGQWTQDPTTGAIFGIDYPIRDQGEKAAKFSGYTPGLKFINPSSKYKPSVVDIRMNPIVDATKVYSGCWAIVSLSVYASGKNTPRKGPRFGLQSVMFLADDTPLSGAAPDPRTLYSGVKTVTPPAAPAAAQFGQAPAQPPQIGAAQVYAPPPPPGAPAVPYDPYADFK